MNIKEIKDLVKMLDGTNVVEFVYESEGNKVSIKKGFGAFPNYAAPGPAANPANPNLFPSAAPIVISPQTASATDEKNEGLGPNQVYIVAPMVGTFYRSADPESEPYVQVGQLLEAGQVVCIIEAMKLMNEIESEWRGKIVEILVDNAQPVEFGQPLMILEKI